MSATHRIEVDHCAGPRVSRDQRMIYREIPAMTCRSGCADCCGPVPWTDAELARVADRVPPGARRETLLGVTVLMDPHQPLRCPMVGPNGGCTVYEDRPFMCRLFGTAPAEPRLRCPHGCLPARPLAAGQAHKLRVRQQALPDGQNR